MQHLAPARYAQAEIRISGPYGSNPGANLPPGYGATGVSDSGWGSRRSQLINGLWQNTMLSNSTPPTTHRPRSSLGSAFSIADGSGFPRETSAVGYPKTPGRGVPQFGPSGAECEISKYRALSLIYGYEV